MVPLSWAVFGPSFAPLRQISAQPDAVLATPFPVPADVLRPALDSGFHRTGSLLSLVSVGQHSALLMFVTSTSEGLLSLLLF